MLLKVKLLKGGREETIEVAHGSMSVFDLKKILEEVFLIPVEEQSVVFRGKALLDQRNIGSYGVKDGTKLFLTQKTHAKSVTVATDGGATPAAGGTHSDTEPMAAGGTHSDTEPMETEEKTTEKLVLTVKLLKGGREERIEVENDRVKVYDVKKIMENKCGIPSSQQSLVVAGKALEDSERLCDCNIMPGTVLFLAQKSTSSSTPAPVPCRPSVWNRKTQIWDRLLAYLEQNFTESDADRIVRLMEKKITNKVYDANLDTIELLAIRTLRKRKLNPHRIPMY